jgi:aspartate/methionine/tyrosine aminotransferase
MICNPGNPTGYLYSKEELELLKQLVVKYDLFLFSDEVYKEFCYDGAEYTSVMHLKELTIILYFWIQFLNATAHVVQELVHLLQKMQR